ncbi:MAG: hypothetical protein ACO3VQ_05225 [Ilumatobacteraceae bacterium]
MNKFTVQLCASDADVEFEGSEDEAREVACLKSATCREIFKRYGFIVRDFRGEPVAIYREGSIWKFRDHDGSWVEN